MDTSPTPDAPQAGPAPAPAPVRRLHWGCGEWTPAGWINSDIKQGPGVDLPCDIRDGLPLESDSVDYAVSVHALPEIPWPELVPTLAELRRVLKPGGVLRLGLPDIERGMRAYLEGDRDYFLVPDEDAESIGGKFATQLLWYGYSRTFFTYDFIEELLHKAGFSAVTRCRFGHTASRWPEIVELDSREHESLYVEAVK